MRWDDFSEKTLVLEVPLGLGQGLEGLALVVHSKLGGLVVPQIWSFVLNIVALAKKVHVSTTMAQVVYRRL